MLNSNVNSCSSKFWVQRHLKRLLLILPLGCRISRCDSMCPSVIRLIPELRSNQAVFLFPWNICCLYFLLLDLSLSFIAWFLNTQLFLFYLYTCIIWLEVRNRAQKLCLRRGLFIGYCMWLDTCWKGKVNVFVHPWDWLLFSCMKNIWFTRYLLTVLMTHVAPSPRLHFWGIHANEVSALQAATILVMVRRIEQKRQLKL